MLASLAGLHPAFAWGYVASYIFTEKKKKFNKFTTSEEAIDGKDLSDKWAIVTGSNNGLGKQTVKTMYEQGCNLIMACRNLKKANAARKEILDATESSKGTMEVMQLDLSSLQSVRDFAAAFSERSCGLDYLILNAGIMAVPEWTPSTDGYEVQFATNHLGHQYLTQLLLPKVIECKTRVISLSSLAHGFIPEDEYEHFLTYGLKNKSGPNKETYRPFGNYSITKLSNILFAREMQRRYGDKGVITVSVHPGVITETGLFPETWQANKDLVKVSATMTDPVFIISEFKDTSQGAATTLRCVAMSDSEIKGGHYYMNCHDGQELGDLKPVGMPKAHKNWEESKEARLWALTELLIKEKGFSLEL